MVKHYLRLSTMNQGKVTDGEKKKERGSMRLGGGPGCLVDHDVNKSEPRTGLPGTNSPGNGVKEGEEKD